MTDAIKRAAEAMEDTALSLIGADLGTIYRDDIARAAAKALLSDREGMADEISGIVVGSGYYSTTIGVDAAREAIDAIRAHLLGGEG